VLKAHVFCPGLVGLEMTVAGAKNLAELVENA
jgi:hypothetical protein